MATGGSSPAVLADLMVQHGLFIGESKSEVAKRLHIEGMQEYQLRAIIEWALAERGLESPTRFVMSRLSDPGKWRRLAADIAVAAPATQSRTRRRREQTAGPTEQRKRVGSNLRDAEPGNPYGWTQSSAASLDPQDHNRAGEWSAFRQALNLTREQAQSAGTGGEYRVGGCTRWAVLGYDDFPRPRWDARQLAGASDDFGPGRAPAAVAEADPPADGIGGVYGE